jgi:ABC-type antimicrobial peptide transport system ATPase subunit
MPFSPISSIYFGALTETAMSTFFRLCWERFGWNKEKADELLLPVLKEYNKHEVCH